MRSLAQPRNSYAPGGVRRVTSASSVPIRRARRSTCSMDSLNRARSGSGRFACVCCMASASAIMRSSFLCRGFSRSHSRRFALRFRPSHSSPVPAGLPVSGSAEVVAVVFGFLIRNSILCRPSPSSWRSLSESGLPNVPQTAPCRLLEKCSARRSPAVFPTSHESPVTHHLSPVTSSTLPSAPH